MATFCKRLSHQRLWEGFTVRPTRTDAGANWPGARLSETGSHSVQADAGRSAGNRGPFQSPEPWRESMGHFRTEDRAQDPAQGHNPEQLSSTSMFATSSPRDHLAVDTSLGPPGS